MSGEGVGKREGEGGREGGGGREDVGSMHTESAGCSQRLVCVVWDFVYFASSFVHLLKVTTSCSPLASLSYLAL